MSDPEGSKTPESASSQVLSETLVMNSSPIIRYTKQVLLSLHDSPLVAKPADMPPLSSWFSEDPDTLISKNILNGSAPTRSSDKNVLLAPNKSVFSSAAYGKRQEESSNTRSSHTSLVSRQRHAADEFRARDYGLSSKDARPPRSAEKSYTNRGNDKTERRSTPSQHSTTSLNNKRQQQQQQANSTNDAGRHRRDSRTARSAATDNTTSRSSDRLPEWMDYSPTVDSKSHTIEKSKQSRQNTRPETINDLEAWKRNMKQKESGNGNNPPPEKDAADEVIRNGKTDLDLTLGIGGLDLQSPAFLPQQQQQRQIQTLDFLSVNITEGTGALSTVSSRLERGSRFAKFFAKRDEEAHTYPVQSEPQSRSITVQDLFRGVEGQATASEPTVDMHLQQPAQFVASEPTIASPGTRMLSEEEVMLTLGAKKSSPSTQLNPLTSGDALGFDKVLQILSQPKPTAANQQPQRPLGNLIEKDGDMNENPSIDADDVSSPNSASAEKQMPTEGNHHQPHQIQKPKIANSRFAGNLPTSVLRQMSARSSEGRSPSLSSNRSARSLATGGSSSPALSKGSPSSMKGGVPIATQESAPNGQPYPTAPIYHRIPPTSPGYSLAGTVNPITDPSMIPGRQPRNNGPTYDYLLEYVDPVIGRAGPMNPMIPPPLSYGQGQQQQPRQQQQQQQGMDQFMRPHVMQPMPPHMPPVGPGSHMIPPHHLPLHLQGQVPPQFTPIQREMISPPGVPPPHMMGGAGLPPHLFPKGPGWDRQ
ncbi:hypothetical protein BX666DRAFT_2025936 [Dichotomocladium elegans]|nr:hypothetical protein BX666DRAFT_2025936 [Dichotomocladium elegans]